MEAISGNVLGSLTVKTVVKKLPSSTKLEMSNVLADQYSLCCKDF